MIVKDTPVLNKY